MVSAFIFLAAKVEEQPKKIEYVIKTFYLIYNRDEEGKPGPEVDMKSEVSILLLSFKFMLILNHAVF